MSDYWTERGETPEQREYRLAMCACLNSDVIYRGVRDGLCYFEVYLTDDTDGPKAVLFIPTEGLTAERMSTHAATADADRIVDPELGEWRCPNGHDSAIPPKCPALMFVSCCHYAIKSTFTTSLLRKEYTRYRTGLVPLYVLCRFQRQQRANDQSPRSGKTDRHESPKANRRPDAVKSRSC